MGRCLSASCNSAVTILRLATIPVSKSMMVCAATVRPVMPQGPRSFWKGFTLACPYLRIADCQRLYSQGCQKQELKERWASDTKQNAGTVFQNFLPYSR